MAYTTVDMGHLLSTSHMRAAVVDAMFYLQGSNGGVNAASEVHELLGFMTF